MIQALWAPALSAALLIYLLGFVTGQAIDLGWGLPLGTSLAVFIAACSLGITGYQSYATRKHNRLQVRPHIIFHSQFNSTTYEDHYTYVLSVKNVGLGPALIDEYTVVLDGVDNLNAHSVFEEWVRLVNKVTLARGKARCNAGFLHHGQAIEKGEEKVLLETSVPAEGRTFMQGREVAKSLVKNIDVVVAYSCHYGTKFESTKKPQNGIEDGSHS